MKLSVIISCYNFENYIQQAILSVLAQRTNFEFEILVRDDNSTDKSYENILPLSGYIKLLDSTKNLGPYGNIKTLIDNCQGEYIAYLDGDDYWTEINKLQKQVDYMEQNKDCSMTFTGFWQHDQDGFTPPIQIGWLSIPSMYENQKLKIENLVQTNPGTFGRVFRNIPGLFKDWMSQIRFLDWVTNYELSKYGRVKYLDFPGGVYRADGNGLLSSMKQEKINEEMSEMREIIKADYIEWKNKTQ
jgi:glycosyltransferase involved in cell wall biosynthesis